MVKRLPTPKQDFTLNHYQDIISATDRPGLESYGSDGTSPLWYYALGVGGEAGEFVDKVKKVYRNKHGELDSDTVLALAYELGDVLWYLSRAAAKIGYTLSEIACLNVGKLSDRAHRGVIRSEGDTR
jgi:NTP pyrophosphatase (non-canonical NTP hydrolase)